MTHPNRLIEGAELSPFTRRRAGPRNEFVFREHRHHAEQAVRAIGRREHPLWSSLRCDYEVAA